MKKSVKIPLELYNQFTFYFDVYSFAETFRRAIKKSIKNKVSFNAESVNTYHGSERWQGVVYLDNDEIIHLHSIGGNLNAGATLIVQWAVSWIEQRNKTKYDVPKIKLVDGLDYFHKAAYSEYLINELKLHIPKIKKENRKGVS